jgi:hypothetical protein
LAAGAPKSSVSDKLIFKALNRLERHQQPIFWS